MAGFHTSEYGCIGTLDIDGSPDFPLNCPAWDVVNLDILWIGESIRGQNLALPRVVGTRGRPRRLDEGSWNLVIWVRGDVDEDGIANANHWQGLYDNLQTLYTNVFAPVGTGDGTRACTLTLPDGITQLTADCQFEPLQPEGDVEDPNEAIYTFTVTVPDGRFS